MTLSPEKLKRILKAAMMPRARVIGHEMVLFSEKRHGIMGDHYALTIRVVEPDASDSRTLRLFAKIPTTDAVLRERIVDETVFLEEIEFFRRVLPLLERSYRGLPWCPRLYLADESLLVLEDLRTRGYAMRTNGIFDEPTLGSALSTLARFHASSILAQSRVADTLDRVFPELFKEKLYTEHGKAGRANKLGFDTMQLIAARFGLDGSVFPAILQRIRQLVKPIEGWWTFLTNAEL